mmetsp:Transcript_66475/g.130371  ORF Transcript_66475/g.130371 Transcript_66475/m.130371 type:complete len:227 (-) Transcript_66475:316-996(-)
MPGNNLHRRLLSNRLTNRKKCINHTVLVFRSALPFESTLALVSGSNFGRMCWPFMRFCTPLPHLLLLRAGPAAFAAFFTGECLEACRATCALVHSARCSCSSDSLLSWRLKPATFRPGGRPGVALPMTPVTPGGSAGLGRWVRWQIASSVFCSYLPRATPSGRLFLACLGSRASYFIAHWASFFCSLSSYTLLFGAPHLKPKATFQKAFSGQNLTVTSCLRTMISL